MKGIMVANLLKRLERFTSIKDDPITKPQKSFDLSVKFILGDDLI